NAVGISRHRRGPRDRGLRQFPVRRPIGALPLRTAPPCARRTASARADSRPGACMTAMARILSVAKALPPHYVEQDALLAAFRELWGEKHFNLERLEQLHRAVRVGGRYLALPLEAYGELETFAARNAAWIEAAVAAGTDAVRSALLAADVSPPQVDHLYFVTVTGLATPSIDARLIEPLGLRTDVKRVPIFGLGCVAGAAGLSRVNDVLRGARGETAVLLSVELCSLTLQREDLSIP